MLLVICLTALPGGSKDATELQHYTMCVCGAPESGNKWGLVLREGPQAGAAQREGTFVLLSGTVWTLGSCAACPLG